MSREKKDKREHEYPIQLESQFIIRMPEEPGKVLGELIKSGDNFKNRFTIKINDDLRHGEVRLDHWLLQAKIVDLPTIIESWKSVDRKSIYKTADICQMMICKEKFDEVLEDESLKNKKKDPLKVEKKYLWPHGVTPPTKNVRKRRFRKTLKKKCAEAPEIEKEVKRLLRADNEALSYTWEEDGNTSKSDLTDSVPTTKPKREPSKIASTSKVMSKEEDIFGGALSDSDAEDESFTIEDRKLSSHVQKPSTKSVKELKSSKPHTARGIKSEMSEYNRKTASTSKSSSSHFNEASVEYGLGDSTSLQETDNSYSISKLQECGIELEERKQRRQRTQVEISRMENMTLRQRFQDILKTLNKEIAIKELEYQKLKANYH